MITTPKDGAPQSRRLEEIQLGTLDQGTTQEIAAFPKSTTTYRNCGDMSVSGHTNVVLFSRLFWIDFLHTSWAQQRILKNFFRLFFVLSNVGQYVMNRVRRSTTRGGPTENLDNAWKWQLASLYWYEETVTIKTPGGAPSPNASAGESTGESSTAPASSDDEQPSFSTKKHSLSRLELILKTWEGHLQYFYKVFSDMQHKEETRKKDPFGNTRSWNPLPAWRSQEIALRLKQKIAATEKDIRLLQSVVEKLDNRFEVHDKEELAGEPGARQNLIGKSLEEMGLEVRLPVGGPGGCAGFRNWCARTADSPWEDREVITAIAGLLWEEPSGVPFQGSAASGRAGEGAKFTRVGVDDESGGVVRRPVNDAGREVALQSELASTGLLLAAEGVYFFRGFIHERGPPIY